MTDWPLVDWRNRNVVWRMSPRVARDLADQLDEARGMGWSDDVDALRQSADSLDPPAERSTVGEASDTNNETVSALGPPDAGNDPAPVHQQHLGGEK